MNCGEVLLGGVTRSAVGEQLHIDATNMPPFALTWTGDFWQRWCSPWCAAFGRHTDRVTIVPSPAIATAEVSVR